MERVKQLLFDSVCVAGVLGFIVLCILIVGGAVSAQDAILSAGM